jgi:hypothetical protein
VSLPSSTSVDLSATVTVYASGYDTALLTKFTVTSAGDTALLLTIIVLILYSEFELAAFWRNTTGEVVANCTTVLAIHEVTVKIFGADIYYFPKNCNCSKFPLLPLSIV